MAIGMKDITNKIGIYWWVLRFSFIFNLSTIWIEKAIDTFNLICTPLQIIDDLWSCTWRWTKTFCQFAELSLSRKVRFIVPMWANTNCHNVGWAQPIAVIWRELSPQYKPDCLGIAFISVVVTKIKCDHNVTE